MNLRAYWQFYRTMLPFCLAFGIVTMLAVGLLWGFLFFTIVGPLIGLLGFKAFRNGEYFFYYNLGLTKLKLFRVAFIFNLAVAIPVFCLLSLFKFLVIGAA